MELGRSHREADDAAGRNVVRRTGPIVIEGAGDRKDDAPLWARLAREYRTGSYRGQEIVRARLHAGLHPDHPAVVEMVRTWPGRVWLHEDADGVEAVLVGARPGGPPGERWWLHLALFLLTLLTTHMAGALLAGVDPFATRLLPVFGIGLPVPTTIDWDLLARGSAFALPFMAILLIHETGHYVAARVHGIPVTPPFFIPFPAYWSIVGTLGAFIRIRGPMVRRSILFDVGAAGPFASFLLSLPVTAWGLWLSRPVADGAGSLLSPYLISFAGQPVRIGNAGAMHLLALPFFPDALGSATILLHPVAFAGWLGLFVTALNLLPLGQLDGGHVLYALSGRLQRVAGRLFFLALLPLGFVWWGWWLWAGVVWFINRGRAAHPPLLQEGPRLDPLRRRLAWACVAIFLLTFVPVPVRL